MRLERKCSVASIRGDWNVEGSPDGCRGWSGYVGCVSWWELEGGVEYSGSGITLLKFKHWLFY